MTAAALGWGVLLGAGLLLVASPWLWPAGRSSRPRRDGPLDGVRRRLTDAGLDGLPPLALIAIGVLAGLAVAGLVQAFVGVVVVAIVAGVAAACAPFAIVGVRARAARAAVRAGWPDVVDHLTAGIRAGLALPDAVAGLAAAGPPATRAAFDGFRRDYQATGDFGGCLDRLKVVFADPTADRILETLRMAREVGGSDIGEVLRGLSAYLREDANVRAELAARQSWVVNAARLGVVAPWIVLALLASRPEGAAAYNSPIGTVVIVVGVIVSFAAYRLMLRIGRLPEPQRWFR